MKDVVSVTLTNGFYQLREDNESSGLFIGLSEHAQGMH